MPLLSGNQAGTGTGAPEMLGGLKEIIERFVFDPSLVDLVLWFPHLSWEDFFVSALVVCSWKLVTDRMEKLVGNHIRRALARGLFAMALLVRPDPVDRRPRRKKVRRIPGYDGPPRIAAQRGYNGPAYYPMSRQRLPACMRGPRLA